MKDIQTLRTCELANLRIMRTLRIMRSLKKADTDSLCMSIQDIQILCPEVYKEIWMEGVKAEQQYQARKTKLRQASQPARPKG